MIQKIQYWLMKSEPSTFSIDDLKQKGFSEWDGVRNFQARNFMRDGMHVGDLALFYHSNANPSGIAGICRICKEAHPDFTAWDKKSPYYDPKASADNPIWMMVEVEFVEKFSHFISLLELKNHPQLRGLRVLEKKHFELIRALGNKKTSSK